MRTFSNIKGLTVYDLYSGKELGEIEDLCFNDEGVISGILMDANGWFKRDRVIPIENVHAIGHDGVMIDCTMDSLRTKKKADHILHDSHNGIIGKPLLTTEGEKLGLVEDVYFQEELGTIIGYEVTDGFFADITEGRKVIKTDSPLTIGENTIVVNIEG